MRPLTKITGKDRFELMFRIRQKEGWKRGKIRKEANVFKHFNKAGYKGQWLEYVDERQILQWTCYMYKEWEENHEQIS